MFTINSHKDTHALSCSNFVASNAFVDKHSSSCHCSVPNSCTVCFVHLSSIHIQLIRMDSRIAISRTVEGDVLYLADCCFTSYQLDRLRFNYNGKNNDIWLSLLVNKQLFQHSSSPLFYFLTDITMFDSLWRYESGVSLLMRLIFSDDTQPTFI